MGTCCFLFDADHASLGGYYGGVLDNLTMSSLVASDTRGHVTSRILRGDVFLPSLCDKIVAVEQKKKQSSWTYRSDRKMHVSLVARFVEEIRQQWNSMDIDRLLQGILERNTYCITITTLSKDIAIAVDKKLKANAAYYGAFEIDLGNPVQVYICLHLPEFCYIKDGLVYFEDEEGVGNNSLQLKEFSKAYPQAIKVLAMEEYKYNAPKLPNKKRMTTAGKNSLTLFKAKAELSEYQKVLELLTSAENVPDLEIKVPKVEDIRTFIMDEQKFVEYLLDKKHPHGGSKAKFFNGHLRIYKNDWRFLSAQFYYGIKRSPQRKVGKIDRYGVRYEITIPIIGKNRKVKSVRVCWIIQNDRIKMVTAIPDRQVGNGNAVYPPIVDESIPLEKKWQAIYDMAVERYQIAVADCKPTPMIVGGVIIQEGECGGAYVHLPDARSSFARWLKKKECGENDYKSGLNVTINSGTQSHDREKAGAEAFSEVLVLNGIDCIVKDYLT